MASRTHIKVAVLWVLFGVWLGVGCVHAQNISYSGSMQYETGSYFFSENTESFSFVNGIMVSGDKTNISFSVPLIYQNSPWISYSATGFIPTGGSQHGSLKDSTGRRPGKGPGGGGSGMGKSLPFTSRPTVASDSIITLPDTVSFRNYSIGDPTIYANINIYRSNSGYTSLQLNSNLKFPIADPANGYGTGEWDLGVGTSLSQRFFGNNYLYLDIMKWWFGDMPDLELQNAFSYNIGLSHVLAQRKWMLSASLSGFTELINDYEPPLNAGIGVGYFLSSKMTLNSTFSMGLTESSSDAAFGLGWSIRF